MTDAAEADRDETASDGVQELDPLGDELVAQVAADDEAVAAVVSDLQERVADAESTLSEREDRVDELESSLKRSQADFQNYKKRAKKREEQIRERATEDLVGRLLEVRDNLGRAISQEDDAGVREGVEATLETFDRILADENVSRIEPAPGEEVDPTVHEVVARLDGTQPEDTIEEVFRPGYEMAGKVLRAAQVTVSDGGGDGEDVASGDGEDARDAADAPDG